MHLFFGLTGEKPTIYKKCGKEVNCLFTVYLFRGGGGIPFDFEFTPRK
jgi:hypothetical protein